MDKKISLATLNDKKAFCEFLNKRKRELGLDDSQILNGFINPVTRELYSKKTLGRWLENEGRELPQSIKAETWEGLKNFLKTSTEEWARFKQEYDAVKPKTPTREYISDDSFLSEIKIAIQNELNGSKVFYDNLISVIKPQTETSEWSIDKAVSHLTEQCMKGCFVSIAQYSQSALRNSWDSINKDKNYEVEQFFKAAEGFFVKLALFNVDINWVVTNPNGARPVLNIPKINLETLELVLSRYSRTSPSNPKSKILAEGVKLHGKTFVEAGIKTNDVVLYILKTICAELYPNILFETDNKNPEEEKKQLGIKIDEKLIYRKTHPDINFRQTRFILISLEEGAVLKNPRVQEELKKWVKELEWIAFTTDRQEQVFVINDTTLMSALDEFFSTFDDLYKAWTDSRK